jgi:isopentenyl-diphosphate delta-isomerase
MVDAEECVILVDADDRPLGRHTKLEAHRLGLRHRAFSVFLADKGGNLLLQSRSTTKYHSPGLWSNACCGHPRIGEASIAAAQRRLGEEMGIDADLMPAGRLSYCAALSNGWQENEIVHLFVGRCDLDPAPDPKEVGKWRRVQADRLAAECQAAPGAFTAWFKIYLDQVPDVALIRSRV